MITPIEANEAPKIKRGKRVSEKFNLLFNDLRDFVDGGCEMCEITDTGYKDAKAVYYAILYAVKHYELDVRPMKRGERVFLVRGGGDD